MSKYVLVRLHVYVCILCTQSMELIVTHCCCIFFEFYFYLDFALSRSVNYQRKTLVYIGMYDKNCDGISEVVAATTTAAAAAAGSWQHRIIHIQWECRFEKDTLHMSSCVAIESFNGAKNG